MKQSTITITTNQKERERKKERNKKTDETYRKKETLQKKHRKGKKNQRPDKKKKKKSKKKKKTDKRKRTPFHPHYLNSPPNLQAKSKSLGRTPVPVALRRRSHLTEEAKDGVGAGGGDQRAAGRKQMRDDAGSSQGSAWTGFQAGTCIRRRRKNHDRTGMVRRVLFAWPEPGEDDRGVSRPTLV